MPWLRTRMPCEDYSPASRASARTICFDDRGEATSVSVFDDASGAEESNRQAADWLRENLTEMSPSPPDVIAGDAVLSF